MRARRLLFAAVFLPWVLAACDGPKPIDPHRQIGPNPFLPDIHQYLLPPMKVAKPIGAISPEEGAKTIIYLASSPEVARTSGEYFSKCAPAVPSAEARNDQDAKKLWNVSAEIAADVSVKD